MTTLEVDSSDTIDKTKANIQDTEGINPINNISFSLASNLKMTTLFLIITFRRSPLYTIVCKQLKDGHLLQFFGVTSP